MPDNTLTSAECRLEWPLLQDAERRDLAGVHAVLVVIRHMYSFLEDADIPDYDTEPWPVLKAARMLFDKADPAEYDKALFLKTKAVAELLSTPDAPAIEIFKSKLLADALWSRDVFHLWQRRDFARLIDKENPKPWELAEKTDLAVMADESLVEYNGSTTLADCIEHQFGIFDDHATGWQWLRLARLHTFIRVHYNPKQGQRRSYHDIRTLTAKVNGLRFKDTSSRTARMEVFEQLYTIIAAVRLRDPGTGERDIVRTYDDDGIYPQHPMDATTIIDYDARIGENDHEWLLFYARSNKVGALNLPNERLEEVVRLDPVLVRNLRRLKYGTMGAGDRMAPWPMAFGGQAAAAASNSAKPAVPTLPTHQMAEHQEQESRGDWDGRMITWNGDVCISATGPSRIVLKGKPS
ncbi:uncharacterized protein PG986_014676 [Apiospora aurea]|uniref:Uncharacterized protein n=1 Tax=Apiospora aurea TaxID=335848 RepID=A0ABR1PTZ9_9PEZI